MSVNDRELNPDFPKLKRRKIMMVNGECPLKWKEISVLSALIGKKNKMSMYKLANITDTNQTTTLPSILSRLSQYSQLGLLLTQQDNIVTLHDCPYTKWFVPADDTHFCYFWLSNRTKQNELSPAQNHLYWMLRYLLRKNRRNRSYDELARIGHMDDQTVRDGMIKLKSIGWLNWDGVRLSTPAIDEQKFYGVESTPDYSFLDRPKKTRIRKPKKESEKEMIPQIIHFEPADEIQETPQEARPKIDLAEEQARKKSLLDALRKEQTRNPLNTYELDPDDESLYS